ncbi:MAG: hypothetical protein R3F02_18490 [Thiolinea sp.]
MNLFDPNKIERDEFGFFSHPDCPGGDEGIDIRPALAMMGFEAKLVEMPDDHTYDSIEYPGEEDRGGHIGARDWNPKPPQVGNWLLASIYDTEDYGPVALFVRAIPDPKRERLLDGFLLSESNSKQEKKMDAARRFGKRGWWSEAQCSDEFLKELLICSVADNDWISVANYAAMLDFRNTHGRFVPPRNQLGK